MAIYRIRGGKKLAGTIRVCGSKNAVLPILAATLLTSSPCRIENVPRIADVTAMLAIIESVGAKVKWLKEHTLEVHARTVDSRTVRSEFVSKLRGSILLAGALLARTGRVQMSYPGGDQIGSRPIGVHLDAFRSLDASVRVGDTLVIESRRGPNSRRVVLTEPNVTATENALLAASRTPGVTEIRLAAMEPHVQALAEVLTQMGAHVDAMGTPFLRIRGRRTLRGFTYRLRPDELEISALAVLAAATRSRLDISPIVPEQLDGVFTALNAMGVRYDIERRILRVSPRRGPYRTANLQVGLYPKLGSDHLPPFAVLATQADGATLLHEWMYEGRLRYIEELNKMGANALVLDPHRAIIIGPTPLTGREITGFDIRSGMVLVIAALVAQGTSTIHNVEHLDRGYERLEERLKSIGADIQRIQ